MENNLGKPITVRVKPFWVLLKRVATDDEAGNGGVGNRRPDSESDANHLHITAGKIDHCPHAVFD